tara:strand:- start:1330 stop:1668 length:339 start_codon:yes stop_codon:yes gene_type:complete
MVRKSKNTDMKVDGAYADIVAPPRMKGDPTGQSKALDEQANAISPLAQEAIDTGGMLNYQPEEMFDRQSERPDESGLADTLGQETVSLPQGTDTQILIELIKEKAPVTRQRF